MTINIFHHHLNRGGVTRIIQSQIESLKKIEGIDIRIFSGHNEQELNKDDFGVDMFFNVDLNYLTEDLSFESRKERFENILGYLKSNCNKKDIFHVHNCNLGKNPLFTLAVYELAKEGYYVFNHAHDFAEDRPANMDFYERCFDGLTDKTIKEIFYPPFENYLYGTLNFFDFDRLGHSGIAEDRRFNLPNPVMLQNNVQPEKQESKDIITKQFNLDPKKLILTYPVRAIERKNIGEYILLSELLRDKAHFLISLPPQNPKEVVKYDRWKQFVSDNSLNVKFEIGLTANFEQLLSATDFCMTTSYREGFGMVYMEPWLLNTPVIGRSIPYIIKDLSESGMQFPALYNQLLVPHQGATKDFKDLPVNEQQNIILKAKGSSSFSKELFEKNTILGNLLNNIPTTIIDKNKEIISQQYSITKYGERLQRIYRTFNVPG